VNGEVRLICFDLGRVLIRLCDGWHHACEMAGVPLPPFFSDQQRAQLQQLVHISECGQMCHDEFCQRSAQIMGIDPVHVDALSTAFLRDPFPGALQLVQELKDRGFLTACLSNTNASHWQIMCAETGASALALTRMDYRFGSHEIGVRKPDAEIYRHVERATGLNGSQIVFFDDILENVEGARALGWRAHQVTDRTNPVKQMRQRLRDEGVNATSAVQYRLDT
jgi:putative hydrolase of the HAD superfamily